MFAEGRSMNAVSWILAGVIILMLSAFIYVVVLVATAYLHG